MSPRTGIMQACEVCTKEFYVPAWWKLNGAKFCSKPCYYESKRGSTPWNKGTKGLSGPNSGSFTIGEGRIYKGTMSNYKSLHYKVTQKLGRPQKCTKCGTDEASRYHWANISGSYLMDESDWIRLCPKCHYDFDKHDDRRAKNI